MKKAQPQFSFVHLVTIGACVLGISGLLAAKNPGILHSLKGQGSILGNQTTYVEEWNKHVAESNEMMGIISPEPGDADGAAPEAMKYLPGFVVSKAVEELGGISPDGEIKGAVLLQDFGTSGPRGWQK